MEGVELLDGGKWLMVEVPAVASWLDHPLAHRTLSLPFSGQLPQPCHRFYEFPNVFLIGSFQLKLVMVTFCCWQPRTLMQMVSRGWMMRALRPGQGEVQTMGSHGRHVSKEVSWSFDPRGIIGRLEWGGIGQWGQWRVEPEKSQWQRRKEHCDKSHRSRNDRILQLACYSRAVGRTFNREYTWWHIFSLWSS